MEPSKIKAGVWTIAAAFVIWGMYKIASWGMISGWSGDP